MKDNRVKRFNESDVNKDTFVTFLSNNTDMNKNQSGN